jgi:hypothetical protein
VRKNVFFARHFILKPEHLPRQARDKHRKLTKRGTFFSRSYLVNGKPLETSQYFSFGGQVATFVTDYLDAPVSLKEILQDMGQAGATLHPVRPTGQPTDQQTNKETSRGPDFDF